MVGGVGGEDENRLLPRISATSGGRIIVRYAVPPPLSATSPEAVALYRRGTAALVAGMAHARTLLAEAIAREPGFFAAEVAHAVACAANGDANTPPATKPGLTRGERQHGEVVEAAFTGDHRHAADLRREHLAEYPADLLIVWLRPQPWISGTSGPRRILESRSTAPELAGEGEPDAPNLTL